MSSKNSLKDYNIKYIEGNTPSQYKITSSSNPKWVILRASFASRMITEIGACTHLLHYLTQLLHTNHKEKRIIEITLSKNPFLIQNTYEVIKVNVRDLRHIITRLIKPIGDLRPSNISSKNLIKLYHRFFSCPASLDS